MTLNTYITELLELQKQGLGECIMIYSSDDEGNAYHKVHNVPVTAEVEDLREYYLEIKDTEDNPNVIFVN